MATQAERLIDIAHKALDSGPMGAHWRGPFYKKFVGVGRDKDLSKIKTSCAVFIHGVLHFAGRLDHKPDVPGMGIFDGWLEGLTYWHPAWEDAKDKNGKWRKPPPGAIFYRAYSKNSPGTESHVGMLLFETTPGLWVTAEGGGSPDAVQDKELLAPLTTTQIKELNGTVCRISRSPKDIFKTDSLGRVLIGWWRPELLDGFTDSPSFPVDGEEPTTSTPTPSQPTNPPSNSIPGDDAVVCYTGKYIKRLQRHLKSENLYSLAIDGKFGKGSYNAFVRALGREDLVEP